jgi:hypothetical protein
LVGVFLLRGLAEQGGAWIDFFYGNLRQRLYEKLPSSSQEPQKALPVATLPLLAMVSPEPKNKTLRNGRNTMKKRVLNLLFKISRRLRMKRIRTLKEHLQLTDGMKILDVGGSGDWDWKSFGIQADVTMINIDDPPETGSSINYIQGNACDMHMFADNEFDLVFSNSVIEHLPNREDQQKMAAEICRVGRSYWVQTPNRHFPLELHLCFPLIQYWPIKWRMAFARIWPFSFERLRGRVDGAVRDAQVILLSKKQMQTLFPSGNIISEKFAGITKSLIAVKTDSPPNSRP